MSKKSNVHGITTGKPLTPVPDHIWLIVLFHAHHDQASILAIATNLVPEELWGAAGIKGIDARVAITCDVARQLSCDLAAREIDDSILDAQMHIAESVDDAYVEFLTDDAIGDAVTERMPRAVAWSAGMPEEEVDDRIAKMLRDKVIELLGG